MFALFIKYNVLMALSAANLPFALPENFALGLIMIAGHACEPRSRGLDETGFPRDLAMALAIGFAPAALIGMPGLIGLVTAIAARMACVAFIRRSRPAAGRELDVMMQLTEVCFYLGALASWTFI